MKLYKHKTAKVCPALRTQSFIVQNHREKSQLRKAKKKELLLSETEIQNSKQHNPNVETVFAKLKHKQGFKKIDLGFELMAIDHNLRKKIAG
jgi:adenine-specific DNA glycosylase